MDQLFHHLAQHWHMSQAQYLHMRLLSATALLPVLAVVYLALFGRKRH